MAPITGPDAPETSGVCNGYLPNDSVLNRHARACSAHPVHVFKPVAWHLHGKKAAEVHLPLLYTIMHMLKVWSICSTEQGFVCDKVNHQWLLCRFLYQIQYFVGNGFYVVLVRTVLSYYECCTSRSA